ncbi:hypothetical protein [Brevibacillus sp. 179-C9.3 HS]|uniref:hypothetical protein n=1 Tax=unclassified Brevibacillus TaxID=2684853 RepID=UPI0039A2F437
MEQNDLGEPPGVVKKTSVQQFIRLVERKKGTAARGPLLRAVDYAGRCRIGVRCVHEPADLNIQRSR